ncbi:Glycosyltransferase involved in cell wall bisynthesis [Abditibacterium utsteinense]|uniref:Glycosyltransferase involved in cell wall bisynthesis n=1 Tax=Abditibacterium utsteinense TaxID=1960156 RepID=A0A2S8SWS9_9BACT|nr:glycosyltransferase family 4 protein [Abditibacterium utsteinense]PQV65209.1 Glycosyltransferase involved in cell wall bisynthesis [Abditibacterium utsteinense]
MVKIALVAAALPPQLNGIGDYTANLARELAKSHQVSILTATNTPFDPILGLEIHPIFRIGDAKSFRAIDAWTRREKPDWIVLQYQCFSYGKWGFNLELPRAMARVARHAKNESGTRFALMMHEPFVRATTPKNAVMSLWQRWQLWSLGQNARANFFSIEAWQNEFSPWFPRRANVHLPVMSNIPALFAARDAARRELGLENRDFVLGIFGTAHDSRLLERALDAARAVSEAGWQPVVLYIGPHGAAMRAALPGLQILAPGALPAPEISRHFAAMDIYLATFVDGVSTRRGSLMAALQHGVPVVGTAGNLTDTLWHRENGRSIALAPVADAQRFAALVADLVSNPEKRQKMGSAGRALYEREFSVEVTARHLMETLDSIAQI